MDWCRTNRYGNRPQNGIWQKNIVGDKKLENAHAIAKVMNDAEFDAIPLEMDLSSCKENVFN